METQRWTMAELVTRVAATLASATYAGAPNGRVRDVPDARAIRWYSTIGLVDKPVEMRGRTALYGPRHLLQLVAVKRRQAEGRSIADIQAELAGAPDETLRRIAALPADDNDSVMVGATRSRFWAEPRPLSDELPDEVVPVSAVPVSAVPDGSGLFTGLPLGGGALLLLPGTPEADDLPAITAAAGPLIDILVERRIIVLVDGEALMNRHRRPVQDPDIPLANQPTDSRTDVTR